MNTSAFENRRHTEADQMRVGSVDQNVARLQGAVPDADGGSTIERLRQVMQARQRIGDRRRPILPQRDVERFTRGPHRDEVRIVAIHTGLDDNRSRRVTGPVLERSQFVGDPAGDLRRQVQLELLDRHRGPALWVLATKNGTQAADPNLVQHSKAAEGRGRNVGGSFPGHGTESDLITPILCRPSNLAVVVVVA